MNKNRHVSLFFTELNFRHIILLIIILLSALSTSCFSPAKWNQIIRKETRRAAPDNLTQAFVDKQYAPSGDAFCVTTRSPQNTSFGSILLPMDGIEYGLVEFAGLDKNYKYFERILRATQKGLLMKGYAQTMCIYYNIPMMIQFVYHKKVMHVEVLVNQFPDLTPESFAIDVSKIVNKQ